MWLESKGWKWEARSTDGIEVGLWRGGECIRVLAGEWGEVRGASPRLGLTLSRMYLLR